jgi:hypothetical protein
MSILIENLLGDLRSIFGEAFGATQPSIANLQEETTLAVQEAHREIRRPKGDTRFPIGKEAARILSRGGKAVHGHRPAAKISPADQAALARLLHHQVRGRAAEKEKARLAQIPGIDDLLRDLEKDSKAAAAAAKDEYDPIARRKVLHRHPAASAASAVGHAQGNQDNYPFKRHSNLGPGPGTPPGVRVSSPLPNDGKRIHKEKGCWHCVCPGGTYAGCRCRGTGKDDTCPKGHVKVITIRKDYHRAYNDEYHDWEAEHGSIEKRKPEPHEPEKGRNQDADAGSKWGHKHQDKAKMLKRIRSGGTP